MFSEDKVKEARNDSPHVHMAARHVDVRAVCLHAAALRGPEREEGRTGSPTGTRTVLGLHPCKI